MKEELEKLEKSIKKMNEIVEIISKYGNDRVMEHLTKKRIEEGIIDNLSNASIKQLKTFNSYFRFNYLDKEYVKNKINNEIKRKEREQKLNRVLK